MYSVLEWYQKSGTLLLQEMGSAHVIFKMVHILSFCSSFKWSLTILNYRIISCAKGLSIRLTVSNEGQVVGFILDIELVKDICYTGFSGQVQCSMGD